MAIYLEDDPPSKQISDAVAAEFEPKINAKAAEIRDRIRPFRRQNQALPPNVKTEVGGCTKASIGRPGRYWTAAEEPCRRQPAARTHSDRECGRHGLCTASTRQYHWRTTFGYAVTQIAASEDVKWIELDPVVVPGLADSAQIIYAPRFWDAGYDGGCYDVGIVDRGVEDENRYLRSKAAGQLIERKPDDPEPTGHHGTAVAGIVAMTAYKDADGEHKGIAYGLDKIIDATWTEEEKKVK